MVEIHTHSDRAIKVLEKAGATVLSKSGSKKVITFKKGSELEKAKETVKKTQALDPKKGKTFEKKSADYRKDFKANIDSRNRIILGDWIKDFGFDKGDGQVRVQSEKGKITLTTSK